MGDVRIDPYVTTSAPAIRIATSCRYCGSHDLRPVVSLGEHPPSNSFLREEDIPRETRAPLEVVRCGPCALSQLRHTVDLETVFDDYLYLSSTSQALRQHYGTLAKDLSHRFGLGPGDLVVDIGCNDGVLLREFDPRLARVGVEPSRVGELARREGLEVVGGFFGRSVAHNIVSAHGTASLVTATNVFAHVDRIGDFTDGLPELLGDDGIFVAEMSYLPHLIDGVLFDTIYHEHILYLSLTPMIPFLAAHGLYVFDVELVPLGASGPAFRVFASSSPERRVQTENVGGILSYERGWGIDDDARYLAFSDAVGTKRRQILDLIEDLTSHGGPLGAYGAPAKGNTLLNFLNLDRATIAMIAETNPLKQGLVAPGSHIPIVSEAAFLETMPAHALLLSWNYVDHFLQSSEYIRRGGRFLVPLPEPRVLPT